MKHFLLFSATLLLILSCQKNIDYNSTSNQAPNDSIYISTIVELDATVAAPLDTTFKIEIKYDNQHRVISFLEIQYYNTGSAYYTDTPKNATVFYNGIDSLPYKSTMLSDYIAPSRNLETHFYTFSPTGFRDLIYDSIRYTNLASGSSGIKIRTCAYYNDSTILKDKDNSFPVFTTKYNITKSGGDIILQDDGFLVSNQKYDTKPNPLIRLKFLLSEFYRIGAEYNENRYLEFQPNNLMEINNEASFFRTKFKYYHTYNGNGHPTETTIQNLVSSPQRPNKIKYFYTK